MKLSKDQVTSIYLEKLYRDKQFENINKVLDSVSKEIKQLFITTNTLEVIDKKKLNPKQINKIINYSKMITKEMKDVIIKVEALKQDLLEEEMYKTLTI